MNSIIAKMMFIRAPTALSSRLGISSLNLLAAARRSMIANIGIHNSKIFETGCSFYATCPKSKANPALAKFQAMAKNMQKDDGKPVWQKNPYDYKLYQLTWALLILGMIMNFSLYISYII